MSGSSLAVLVVDGSDLLRSLVSHYLDAESDLQVVASVGTADAAVRQVRHDRPDVIPLDHDMPRGNGLEALPELGACAHARGSCCSPARWRSGTLRWTAARTSS